MRRDVCFGLGFSGDLTLTAGAIGLISTGATTVSKDSSSKTPGSGACFSLGTTRLVSLRNESPYQSFRRVQPAMCHP